MALLQNPEMIPHMCDMGIEDDMSST